MAGDKAHAIIGTSLCAGGVALAFSAVFTAGSFLHYAAAVTGLWRAVTNAAQECASYRDFVTAWTWRQQVAVAVDRNLPWWLSWLVLAGVLLAAYFGLSWYLAE